jgi:hypothetical protein
VKVSNSVDPGISRSANRQPIDQGDKRPDGLGTTDLRTMDTGHSTQHGRNITPHRAPHAATHVFEEPLDRLWGHGGREVVWVKGEDEVCPSIGGVLSEPNGFASGLGADCPGDDCAWVPNICPGVSGERDELET